MTDTLTPEVPDRLRAALAARPQLGRVEHLTWQDGRALVSRPVYPAAGPLHACGAEVWLRWAEELQDCRIELYQGRDHLAISVLGTLDGVPVELCELVYERAAEILLEGRTPEVDQVVPGRIEALRRAVHAQHQRVRPPTGRYAYRGRLGAPHRRALQLAEEGQLRGYRVAERGGPPWHPYALPRGEHRYVPGLVGAGLLEVEPDQDGRCRYRLTQAGREALARAQAEEVRR